MGKGLLGLMLRTVRPGAGATATADANAVDQDAGQDAGQGQGQGRATAAEDGTAVEDEPTAATNAANEPTVFVLEFSGDTTASQVRVLRKAVTLILKVR